MNGQESATTPATHQNSFDVVCSSQESPKPVRYDRLEYTLRGKKKILRLATKNHIHSTIFKAIIAGIPHRLATSDAKKIEDHIRSIIRPFISWINSHDKERAELAKYQCLTDYDTYCRNVKKVKNSWVNSIKRNISYGLDSDQLSKDEVLYLTRLLKLTKQIPQPQAESYTLTRWFNLKWFRDHLDERLFLQIESPQRLIMSLRVTAAVTLLHLLKCRQQWQKRFPPLNNFDADDLSHRQSYRYEINYWLIRNIARFDSNGQPADALTELLLLDICDDDVLPFLRSSVESAEEWRRLPARAVINGKLSTLWKSPGSFTDSYSRAYTRLEEMLAAWLCACEGVQPSDIFKLKATDFVCEYKENGRLIFMQLKYYKGRAGNMKETDLLAASDIWTQALHKYIQQLPEPGLLFRTSAYTRIATPNFTKKSPTTGLKLLASMWKLPDVENELNKEFSRTKCSPIFLKAMQTLEIPTKSGAIVEAEKDHENRSPAGNRKPLFFLTLTHIKNSSVHARSDRYRESDLINHNSHTSQTEKHSYLTDSNKEWVNQCGRITRIVLHDLQNVVYQPSLDKMVRDVRELELRTRVVGATGDSGETVISLDTMAATENFSNQDDIIVTDTLDSALYFLHYINQAEANFHQLVRVRPDFVEKTLIPQIEWMTRLLTQMSHTKQATNEYKNLKHYLPALFDHLLASVE